MDNQHCPVSAEQLIADLSLLTDLLYVHMVPGKYEAKQHEAIALAEHLAMHLELAPTGGVAGMHHLFELMVELKSYDMKTRDGYCWTDLMRKHVLDLKARYATFARCYPKETALQRTIGDNAFSFKNLLSFEQRKKVEPVNLDFI